MAHLLINYINPFIIMYLHGLSKHYIKYYNYRLQQSLYKWNLTYYIKALGLHYNATKNIT